MSLPGPGEPRTAARPAGQRPGAGALACLSIRVYAAENAQLEIAAPYFNAGQPRCTYRTASSAADARLAGGRGVQRAHPGCPESAQASGKL